MRGTRDSATRPRQTPCLPSAAAADAVVAATAKEETKQTHTHKKKSDKGWKEDVLLGPVKDRIVVGRRW